jgi:methylase of polypeptide subunit release factors
MIPTTQAALVLGLAHRHSTEQEQFSVFLSELRSVLRSPWISEQGRRETLADYLDRRRDQRSARTGDEPRVVDPLVRQLLESLGYSEGDFTYNEPQSGISERSVPDYTVRVPEFLGPVPVFLVESKSTSIQDFQRLHRRGQSGQESPLDQLRRYVLAGAVHGRIGLLCNGWKLEAWELGGDGDTRLVQVDLHALARAAAVDAEETFPGAQRPALQSLWNRVSRAAFLQARDLRDAVSRVPPPTADWMRRIQDPILETGRFDGFEERLITYYEWVWGREAIDVSESPDLLVEALRGLIEQFAEDVLHQLDDGLARFREYEESRQVVEKASRLPRLRQQIALREQNFTLSKEEFERKLLLPLDDWCRRPRIEEIKERVEDWLEGLADHVKTANGSLAEQMSLGMNPVRKSPQPRNGEGERKRLLSELSGELEEVCRQALGDYVELRHLEEVYRSGVRTGKVYQSWAQRVSASVLVGEPEGTFRREFARQTAYVYIVRLLLVRICEDKGLFRRKLSDGGLMLWQSLSDQYLDYASGRSYEYLTRMAYDCAQNVYVHFYGASELFDWYRMDSRMLLRALLVLNTFNLSSIDTDIIGAVYGRYLEEGKHEQGRYYTPKPLVVLMLDRLGYRGEAVLNRRILDLACGSGSFLVEACRRLLEPFRGKDGRIPRAKLAPALEEVQRSIFGLEINPFACYLAETNLLIQVLDLLRQAKDEGIHLAVDRFQVYCVDSLLVDEAILQASEATVILLGQDKATAELLKARVGPFAKGFDFLIGNPPYVRADEDAPAYLAYRRQLDRQPWFTTRHLKWDLYVPFVEQFHRLLSDEREARCCLVTIASIANAPYASLLRELLSRQATLHDVLFAKDLKLFADAAWQDNVIFCFSRGESEEAHRVRRWNAARRDDGVLALQALDEPVQRALSPDEVFNVRPRAELDLADVVPLEEICYITKGMVLHSSERLKDGDIVLVPPSYNPARFGEDLVEDLGVQGKRIRHKSFKREDLITNARDDLHRRAHLGPRELLRGGIGRIEWIEYGENARCPSRVDRPTFPELYDRSKIIFGTFSGIAVDDGSVFDYQIVSHSLTIAILWHRLEDVENRSLAGARQELEDRGKPNSDRSHSFSEWYLCALALSEPIQEWLRSNRRSMKEHVYPNDVKAIPVKIIPLRDQKPFIRLEQERHRLWRELIELEDQGFRIGERIELPVRRLAERFREEHPEIEHLRLFQIPPSVLDVKEPFYDLELARIRASGVDLLLKKEVVAKVGDAISDKEGVARLLARYFASLPGTFAERQSSDFLPRTEEGLLALARYLEEQEEGVRRRRSRIAEIQVEIDRRAWDLYRPLSGEQVC